MNISVENPNIAEAIEYFGGQDQIMVAETWLSKYALRDQDGNIKETDPRQTFERMASGVGAFNGTEIFNALTKREFIPAGRILFGLANPYHKVTLKNCYVVPIKADSIEGIFEAAKDAAKIYSRGGGVGICLSPLRPKGSKVNNAAIFSSGAASFTDLFSTVTGTIGQQGRRGALMLQLSVEHPDCEQFITMKDDVKPSWKKIADSNKEFGEWVDIRRYGRFANVSVQLTDAFFRSLTDNTAFTQHYTPSKDGEVVTRDVDPEKLWNLMISSALNSAEPGLVFWDAMQRESASDYYGNRYKICCTNPCAEMMLAAYDSCNLGSICLGRFVENSFTDKAAVNYKRLEKAVRAGVRFLDQINTVEDEENRCPLPEIREVNLDLRRIGLGVMGFAEMLIRLRIKYGSEESIKFADKLFQFICVTAYDESCEMARELGPFRIYKWNTHKNVPIISRLPLPLQQKIKKYGLRNVTVLSIAPTGSIAIIGQTSSGIEPYYQFNYIRKQFRGGSSPISYNYFEPIVDEWTKAVGHNCELDELPDYFVSAYGIDWKNRVRLQAAVQKWVDSSISSTVNLPESATHEDIKNIFVTAWKSGCKGVTIYRKGSRSEILSDDVTKEEKVAPKPERKINEFPDVPVLLDAKRITFRANNKHRVLLHIGFHPKTRMPIELSIRYGKTAPDLDSLAQALGILASIALQDGMDPARLAKTMRGIQAGWFQRVKIHDADTKPVLVTSVPDAIAVTLMRYLPDDDGTSFVDIDGAEICPSCNHRALVPEGGCPTCRSCGWSNCK